MSHLVNPSLVSPVSGQTLLEDSVSSVIQGVGLLLSTVGITVLIVASASIGNAWHIVSSSVYGATLLLLYGTSALYHRARHPRRKQVLKIVDHASIFLLIAGTYTPFTLVSLNGGWGWSLFGTVWGLAVLGIVWKPFAVNRYELASTLIYLAMGWLVLIAIYPLVKALPSFGILWLVLGGLAFSVGTLFFLSPRIPFNHAVWQVFVLTGCICHYFAIMFYVLPWA